MSLAHFLSHLEIPCTKRAKKLPWSVMQPSNEIYINTHTSINIKFLFLILGIY